MATERTIQDYLLNRTEEDWIKFLEAYKENKNMSREMAGKLETDEEQLIRYAVARCRNVPPEVRKHLW